MDFFEHEIGVAALLDNINIPINMHDFRLNGISISIGIADAIGLHNSKLVVTKNSDISGGFDNRNDVRCNVAALLAMCKDNGRIFASNYNATGFLRAYNSKAIGSYNLRACLGNSIAKVASVGFFNKVRNDFSIGIAAEFVPPSLKLLTEFGKVLDDAVVYDGNLIVTRGMWVGVALTWSAVRCPTGMSDATGACIIEVLHRFS